MAKSGQDWEELGRNIQSIVDRAVNAQDYQKLNQTISQAVDRVADLSSDAVRKAVDATRPKVEPYRPAKQAEVVQEKPMPVLYGSTGGKTAAGVLKITGGSLLLCLGLLVLLSAGLIGVVAGSGFLGSATIPSLVSIAGGGVLLGSGVRTLGWVNRFKAYRRCLGKRTYCSLEDLSRKVGKSVKSVRRELQHMIRQGLFLEGHLDREGQTLIVSHETYQLFEQSRLQLEQRQRQEAAERARAAATVAAPDPQVQEVLDRGNAFLAQIRRCNDRIPGVEISEKISRMELIVQRIFQRAEAHPEVVPDLKKMMDYYLPMTVKLLNAYADMDAQPVQGQTIAASKQEIEATLDTLNTAFEKLLDELFRDAAMDVSSDISVLQTLLAQEGLTEDELQKLKNQRNL